ncbi:MAG: SGNH/GDSL hydrolase family protein [Leuconostoc sp.]|nr:SGNH/GDSL hydrolase family protein [Leuconostoc sp.]
MGWSKDHGTAAKVNAEYAKEQGNVAKQEATNLAELKSNVEAATQNASTAAENANAVIEDVNTAASNADSAASEAIAQANHAKNEGDRAKAEADRLVGTDVSVLDNKITEVTTQLAQKVSKGQITKADLKTSSDSDLLDLNNFNAATRNILQGQSPGTINAVLGKENVIENNIAFGALTLEKVKGAKAILGTNLFQKKDAVDGAIDVTTGNVVANPTYMTTGFIPVQPGEKITNTSGLNTHVYTPEKTYRQSFQNAATITVPSNGAFYRTTLKKVDLDTFVVVRGEVIPPESEMIPTKYSIPTLLTESQVAENVMTNPLYGLKWAALGDSITVSSGSGTVTATGYVNLIATRNKMTAYNYGYNGSSITRNPAMNGYQFTKRYLPMPDDADIVTVFGGTNDFGNNLPIGIWGDTTDDTLYGAVKILIEGLMVKYPTKRIGFILPLPRVGNIGQTGGLKDYVAVIHEVCKRYSMPVLDLYNESGFAPDFTPNKNALMYDGLHPTPAGQLLMSRKIEAFLRRL